jgi:hypothetical protein
MEEENFPRGGVVKRKSHQNIKKNSEDKELFQVYNEIQTILEVIHV